MTTSRPAEEGALAGDLVAEAPLTTRHGRFASVAFRVAATGPEHLALVSGDVAGGRDVLVRVHSECLTGDVFGADRCECGDQLDTALTRIGAEGGVLVYLRGHEGRGIGLVDKVRTHALQDDGLDTVDSALALGLPVDVRDFSPAAAVLRHLDVRSVRLLTNNADKVDALARAGAVVTAREPLLAPARDGNRSYLVAKRDRLGHDLPQLDESPPP